jgi:hypothetical protein
MSSAVTVPPSMGGFADRRRSLDEMSSGAVESEFMSAKDPAAFLGKAFDPSTSTFSKVSYPRLNSAATAFSGAINSCALSMRQKLRAKTRF